MAFEVEPAWQPPVPGLDPFPGIEMEHEQGGSGHGIVFDVFLPHHASRFSKNRPPPVDLQLCIPDAPLTYSQVRAALAEAGGAPVKVSIVQDSDIMFYTLNRDCVPRLAA